jgi:hypothetical protein
MLVSLAALVAGCYHLDGSPADRELALDPDSCFVFTNADLREVTVQVHLSAAPENAFFGTDSNDRDKLPQTVDIVDVEVPETGDIDYDAFTRAIPVLCSPAVIETDTDLVTLPPGVVTEDEHEVIYSASFEQDSEYYSAQYPGELGNCITVSRRIPYLDEAGVSAGECVGLALGLVLGMALIASCIIFLTPLVKKGEGEVQHEQLPTTDATAES